MENHLLGALLFMVNIKFIMLHMGRAFLQRSMTLDLQQGCCINDSSHSNDVVVEYMKERALILGLVYL